MKKYTRQELEALIDNYIVGYKAERNKSIVADKLIKGLSIKEIADKNHLSPTRVKTVIRTFKRNIEEPI